MTDTADLDALETRLTADIEAADDLGALDAVRVAALGKKGEVSLKMRELGKMNPEERQVMGPALNGLRDAAQRGDRQKKSGARKRRAEAALETERIDVTRPVSRGAAKAPCTRSCRSSRSLR